jgi:quercetin dioxygenase-like cupin family protein
MSKRLLWFVIAALVSANAAVVQAQKKLEWGPAPPSLPAGSRIAVVSGDPGKTGPFVLQLEMPNGYVIPPHWHPTDEHVTVKSGQLRFGMGDKAEAAAERSLRPGQSVNLKANMRHWARARGRTVVAVSGNGPFAITYVDPAVDPRNQKPKAK